jgi:hypothetical protein
MPGRTRRGRLASGEEEVSARFRGMPVCPPSMETLASWCDATQGLIEGPLCLFIVGRPHRIWSDCVVDDVSVRETLSILKISQEGTIFLLASNLAVLYLELPYPSEQTVVDLFSHPVLVEPTIL